MCKAVVFACLWFYMNQPTVTHLRFAWSLRIVSHIVPNMNWNMCSNITMTSSLQKHIFAQIVFLHNAVHMCIQSSMSKKFI